MPTLDYKKQYKDLYLPPNKPMLIQVPEMQFLMADGSGDPNGNVEFQNAVSALFSFLYSEDAAQKRNCA